MDGVERGDGAELSEAFGVELLRAEEAHAAAAGEVAADAFHVEALGMVAALDGECHSGCGPEGLRPVDSSCGRGYR